MSLCRALVFFALSIAYIGPVQNANILAFLPSPGRSHVVPFHPFFRELANSGHRVTIFSYFPMQPSTPNVTSIIVEAEIQIFDIGFANLRSYSRLFNWKYLHDELQKFFAQLIREKQFQDFYNDRAKSFDLIFTELYHLDGGFALSERFNCPIIGLSVQPMLTIYHWLLKNPITFSYIPHSYLPYTDDMNFWQRSVNSFFGQFTIFYYNFVSVPTYQEHVDFLLAETGQPSRRPSIRELTRRVSMVFVESHFSCAHVRPNVPNVIDVAGIHIENLKPLPEDIQTFMDGAEHGVIFVSLGTLIDPKLAGELGIKLLNIFKKLPQRIIWKWKVDKSASDKSIAGNLMIRNWLPQIDILNHPKCRLFISHGGYHSIMETIYSGVPILGLPFFTDQLYNMAFIQKLNVGKKIDPDSSQREIEAALHELLTDDSYRVKSRKQSKIFKDRPLSPMKTAIFWTEYILRHGSMNHVKTTAQDLYWYEYLLLDIIFSSILGLVFLVYPVLMVFKKLVKCARKIKGRFRLTL